MFTHIVLASLLGSLHDAYSHKPSRMLFQRMTDGGPINSTTQKTSGALFVVQVIANMTPYRENKDGSKGDKLPEIASGDGVDIVLESGRY